MSVDKDPYGRFDMPEAEKKKKYFSLLMPFKVAIYFYFFVLRLLFIEHGRALAREIDEQSKLSYYSKMTDILFY